MPYQPQHVMPHWTVPDKEPDPQPCVLKLLLELQQEVIGFGLPTKEGLGDPVDNWGSTSNPSQAEDVERGGGGLVLWDTVHREVNLQIYQTLNIKN